MKTKSKLSEKKGVSSPLAQNGFPKPKKVNCFQCQKEFLVKFVIARLTYSKKNDGFHGTDKKENRGKYICDACLLNLYRNDKLSYGEAVSDPKKRQVIRTYIYDGTIV